MIQSDGRPPPSTLKNDTNNNNERNSNNNGNKSGIKMDNIECRTVSTSKMPSDGISVDDESNNNHKRQVVNLNNIQRYQIDGAESPQSIHTDPHHHHHLFLMQQQQQQNQQMNHHHHHHLHHQNHHQNVLEKQHGGGGGGVINPPDNSPSLIVLQPSTQPPSGSVTYSSILSGFNHFATAAGKSQLWETNHKYTHIIHKPLKTKRINLNLNHGTKKNSLVS